MAARGRAGRASATRCGRAGGRCPSTSAGRSRSASSSSSRSFRVRPRPLARLRRSPSSSPSLVRAGCRRFRGGSPTEAAIVAIFLIAWLAGSAQRVDPAGARALLRAHLDPGAPPRLGAADRARLRRDRLSVLRRAALPDPGLRLVPGRPDGHLHDRLHDDGRRPEHRRRLRGPARPRLRRLLRDRRLHDGLVRLGAVRGPEVLEPEVRDRQLPGRGRAEDELQLRRRRRAGRHRRHPPLDLPRPPDRRA